MAPTNRDLEIWKFGGASLADAAAIQRAAALITAHAGPLVVVASALAGVTDLLLNGATLASGGKADEAGRVAARVPAPSSRDRQSRAARGGRRGARCSRGSTRRRASTAISAARSACSGTWRRARATCSWRAASGCRPPSSPPSLAAGRRKAVYVDGADIIATDGHHGGAAPNLPETARRARRRVAPLVADGVIAVVPGFIGYAPDGSVTTLGRGGSDLTATLLARPLSAQPGRAVEGRGRHPHRRSAAGAGCPADPAPAPPRGGGSRALRREGPPPAGAHPARGQPHRAARPLLPRSGRAGHGGLGARATVAISGQGAGHRARPGDRHCRRQGDGRASTASPRGRSAPSRPSTCRSRRSSRPRRKARSGSRCRRRKRTARSTASSTPSAQELASGLIDNVTARRGMAVLAVVGDGMAGSPGVAGRVFTALAAGGINVVAIAQGSSERNISFAVTAADAPAAARRVHAAFQLSKIGGGSSQSTPRTDVVLLGFGRVGRALADQIAAPNGRPAVRVVGLLDRSGYVFEPRGISPAAPARADAREGCRRAADRARRTAVRRRRGADVHGGSRRLAPRRRRRDERRNRRSRCARRSASASTSCSRTRSRWPDRGKATRRSWARRRRRAASCATKRPSARGCP